LAIPDSTTYAAFTARLCWTPTIQVHTVAQRIGDDPATLLRLYTKRRRSKHADEKLSDTMAGLAAGFLNT
jgi:hypothetical protein